MIGITVMIAIMVIVCAVLGIIIIRKIFGFRNISEKKKEYKSTNYGVDEREDFVRYRTVCPVNKEDVRNRKNVSNMYSGEEVKKNSKWKKMGGVCAAAVVLVIGINRFAASSPSAEVNIRIVKCVFSAADGRTILYVDTQNVSEKSVNVLHQDFLLDGTSVEWNTEADTVPPFDMNPGGGMVQLVRLNANIREYSELTVQALIRADGETEERTISATFQISELNTLEDNEDSETITRTKQLSDDEKLWEDVYNKLIGILAESEYDFSNLAIDSYGEFLLNNGFLFLGENGIVKEVVPYTTLAEGDIWYAPYTEADSQKWFPNRARINIIEKAHDVNVIGFEWNADTWTEDYAKACPLIQNFTNFSDIYKLLGITEQMLENCVETENAKVYKEERFTVFIETEETQKIMFLLNSGELGDACTYLFLEEDESHNYQLRFY